MALIVVQRGHVPRTSGATGAPGEQQFAIDTAAKLAPLLKDMGHSVRVIDADERRSRYAGDMFVSIHYDSSSSSSASGASVGYQNDAGKQFAHAWKRHYVAEGWNRGFRGDNYTVNLAQYYGVREARAAGNHTAIITESGFHSNTGDRALLDPRRTARSIALAVGELTGTAPPKEDTMSWQEHLEPTDLAASRFPDDYSTRADRALMHILGLAWEGNHGKIKPFASMLARWPDFNPDGHSSRVMIRANYYWGRRGFDEAERNGDKLDALLDAQQGADTAAILQRIDERHDERSAQIAAIGGRLDDVHELIEQHADGTLDADAVVRRIGELLSGSNTESGEEEPS